MATNELAGRVQEKLDRDLERVIVTYTKANLKMKRVINTDVEEILMTYKRLEYPWSRRAKVLTGKSLPNLRAVFPVSPLQPSDQLQFVQPPEKTDKLNILLEMERKEQEVRDAERSKSPKKTIVRRPKTAQSTKPFTTTKASKIIEKPFPIRAKIIKKGELDDILKRLTKRPIKPIEIPVFRNSADLSSRPKSAPTAANSSRIVRMSESEMKKKAETEKMNEFLRSSWASDKFPSSTYSPKSLSVSVGGLVAKDRLISTIPTNAIIMWPAIVNCPENEMIVTIEHCCDCSKFIY